MLILGVESSCDETAISVCDCSSEIKSLSSVISSQIEIHKVFGGVVPEVAAREHLKSITPIFERALVEAGIDAQAIDAVAVTQGPGLIGPLLVGTSFARAFALARDIPLIPVDHVHAHIHGALINRVAADQLSYPVIAMVASGGHTNLYLMQSPTKFKLLGYSVDDACGESFDKVGKLLGLSYPGGPKIEALARGGDSTKVAMPTMMKNNDNLNFSYSGLKTHMVNTVARRDKQPFSDEDLCAAFQGAAIEQLVRKIGLASKMHPAAKSVIVAGGVSANKEFARCLQNSVDLDIILPELKFCSDNGAMIASYGYWLLQENSASSYQSTRHWEAYSRYKYDDVL